MEHPTEVKATSKAWYQRNRVRAAAKSRQYADEHPDLIRQIKRRYDLKNPMKRRGITHRYRSAKRAVPGRWTSKDVIEKLLAQQHLCYYCGVKVVSLHIDHKIPLARKDLGPTNYPSNIVIACAPCNQSKGRRTADEYIAYRRARGLPINPARITRRPMTRAA
jgi:5-methylcytosine-specific restriction endonuclease McrA